jgi:hypothetical protein
MLNAESLQDRKGKFHLADFAAVLPKRAYPVRLHPYLLALMQKFAGVSRLAGLRGQ